MKNLYLSAITLFGATLLSSSAYANEAHDEGRGSQLERLIDAALERSPDLEALRDNVESVQTQEGALTWWDTPEVRMGYGRDANVSREFKSSAAPNHEYGVALRVFPRSPWERAAARQKLKSESQLHSHSLEMSERALAIEVKSSYWESSYLSAVTKLHQQVVDIYDAQSEGMDALLENGQVTISQSLPAKMKQLDAMLTMDGYQSELAGELNHLARLTGVDVGAIRVGMLKGLDASDFNLPYDAWDKVALDSRADLGQMEVAVAYTQAELKELRAKNLPWIKHIQADYEVRNDYGDRDSAGVQIAVDLPFFASDGGAKKMATATLQSQRRQQAQAIEVIRAEVRALVAQFRSLENEWQQMKTKIGPMMDGLRESIELMKEQQAQSNRNYWDAQIALLELSKKKLMIAHRYQKLLLEAERVLGDSTAVLPEN